MSASPVVSVVIPVADEAENVESVADEVRAALGPATPFEILFVDDGSADATPQLIAALAAADRRVRLVRHARRCGKSQAVRTGVLHARGTWIGTMDGDGQNDPTDLVAMLAAARSAAGVPPLVAGIRTRRRDPWARRVATRVANRLRRVVLGDGCPDTGCGMKLFRREDFLRLPCFEGMHRFLPALFASYGVPLVNHPVAHRARRAGRSKYTNWHRALVGITDMLGVMWLRRRTKAPVLVWTEADRDA
ncbi:glycosyltransferase family 2 protein [Elioraea sp. Yellowstone]|jgi:dolichol-phosphate mannosyltransferase|uniref:glycosyltransferase family 2 protein n=1 Tax=Elioraea sp. Yellowstone TaxID=2592070 RepID=UPI001152F1E7|nr:glycosyltransferase family 2 protein [Elioraea sp. Yellowstone]TQF82471.1 glycosyltransferase family 2 protein [Elioraea sp. Yellowstone]